MSNVVRRAIKDGVVGETHEICRRIDGTTIGVQIIRIEGRSGGPVLLLNCGTHGDEPEGHMALLDVVDTIGPRQLRGTVIGVTALNYPAYEQRRRGNTLDDWNYDMNRLFPGSANGSITQRLAYCVCSEVLPEADIVLDLHSGGNNIYVCERLIIPNDDEKHVRLADAMGPSFSLIAKGAGERSTIASFTNIAAQMGKACVTVELGGSNHRWPEDFLKDVKTVFDGIINVMKSYDMIDGEPEYAAEWTHVDYEPVRNNNGGLIRYEPECRLMAEVSEGTKLMTIVNAFGEPVEEIRAPYDLVILSVPGQPFLPNGGAQIMTIGRVTSRRSR